MANIGGCAGASGQGANKTSTTSVYADKMTQEVNDVNRDIPKCLSKIDCGKNDDGTGKNKGS